MAVVNLDPANDRAPYTAAVDVMELVSVAEVMDRLELGPNGGTPGATAPGQRRGGKDLLRHWLALRRRCPPLRRPRLLHGVPGGQPGLASGQAGRPPR